MDKLCLHKIGSNQSNQAIGPELQNALIFLILTKFDLSDLIYKEFFKRKN